MPEKGLGLWFGLNRRSHPLWCVPRRWAVGGEPGFQLLIFARETDICTPFAEPARLLLDFEGKGVSKTAWKIGRAFCKH